MFSEVKNPAVEVVEMIHATFGDVVGQMIDVRQTGTGVRLPSTRLLIEVDIVYRWTRMAIHQVDQASADALNGGNIELHRTGSALHLARALRYRDLQRARRILDAKSHCNRAGTVLEGELPRQAVGLRINDEIDAPLPIERHVLRPMVGRALKSHDFEQPAKLRWFG
jgi:hypothetical protein